MQKDGLVGKAWYRFKIHEEIEDFRKLDNKEWKGWKLKEYRKKQIEIKI